MARHTRLMREWEAQHQGPKPSPEVFMLEILPGLKTLSVTKIARATSLSKSWAEVIRRGARVPHPMHWPALRALLSHDQGIVVDQ
jgi:hypothetical protein